MPLLDHLRLIDTASLSDADKGLRVLPSAICRLAAGARAVPVVQVPIRIGEADVRPGDLILGDDDGTTSSGLDSALSFNT